MSFDITSVARTAAAVPASAAHAASAGAAASAPMPDSVTVDTIPASPPAEVHEAMGVAAQAYQNLKDNGSELRFKVDEATGKLQIEVHDTKGNLLFTLPPHKVLEVADGGSLH
jgi:putative hemolysin